ncbi:hypothetical protein KSF_085480 [Reticulibacter mediterranei]|uniref:Uncharacterized protein n=1 Tax=Reticulibacter mediterranei TaxID=2778369 RepID=A0A8J3N7I0_9CHLR|nr:hypothetical protein KSF_085480 [Reticulibacter mediterranei]
MIVRGKKIRNANSASSGRCLMRFIGAEIRQMDVCGSVLTATQLTFNKPIRGNESLRGSGKKNVDVRKKKGANNKRKSNVAEQQCGVRSRKSALDNATFG